MRTASDWAGALIAAFFVGMLIATNNGDYGTLLALRAILIELIYCLISLMSRSRIHWDRFRQGMPTLLGTEVA
jgi:hypothetical protein